MNILKYFAFTKTVECGSFTKAAEILNYSQSGVSRMISDLENEWGLSLLERNKSGVRLTSDGEHLLPYAKNLCAEYKKLIMEVDDLRGIQTGIIRIGTFSSTATHWLPSIIKAFQADYPGIEYELLLGDYTEIEEWIAQGRVDCGFLPLPTRAGFETTVLEKDKFLAVLPQGHPLTKLEKIPLEAFCNEPFMLLEKGGHADISELFEKQGLKPEIRFTTWDDYAVMSMVEKGLGLGILPGLILRRNPYNIVTRELAVPAYRTIAFAVRDKNGISAAVRKFTEYLDYREENNIE